MLEQVAGSVHMLRGAPAERLAPAHLVTERGPSTVASKCGCDAHGDSASASDCHPRPHPCCVTVSLCVQSGVHLRRRCDS
eukprot:3296596-Pyramimonas_sp.AAC.1